jgi:hypothetical protein
VRPAVETPFSEQKVEGRTKWYSWVFYKGKFNTKSPKCNWWVPPSPFLLWKKEKGNVDRQRDEAKVV